MNIVRTQPYGLLTLQQQINRMFEQFDQDLFGRFEELGEGTFSPAMDVKEDGDSYIVHLEVPGVPRENIEITLHDGTLTIRGKREQRNANNGGEFRRVERSYGSFARSISLPRSLEVSQVQANLTDGVLEVRLPKSEASKPRQISIGSTLQAEAKNSEAQLPLAPTVGAETQDQTTQTADSPVDTGQAS